ncbi:hypothetical protein GQ600_9591 [Phytophthora cactorum]|nr:hypothetical protein GQ600_9591 [Phytophthora cactorum]
MELLLLLVAGGVDDGIAKQALITAAMTKEAYDLSSLDAVEILWDVCRSGDKQTFDMVTSKIEKKDPRELGQFVETIAGKRTEWLKEEIEKLDKIDKDFSWRMPYADDPEYPEVEEFLRGSEQSWTVRGVQTFNGQIQEFAGLREAKEYAKRCLNEGQEDPFVTITKTRKWFEDSQVKLAQYKAELALLSEIY